MPAIPQTLERRRLNEEIESAFITAAQAAATLETKLSMQKGSLLGDLQDFFMHFVYLTRLTASLTEMDPKSEGDEIDLLKKKIVAWQQKPVPNDAAATTKYIRDGLKLFDDYYKKLMHVGIITLPTRRG